MKSTRSSPPRSASGSRADGRLGRAVSLLAWTVLWALFFSPFLLGLERLCGGDLTGQFYAFARFQFDAITSGSLPLWSPGSFAGFPFAADTQAAVFYPPRYFTLLLSWPFDFPYCALELEVMGHVWLAGVFTYALGVSITRSRAAALVTTVGFALGGFLASYPLSQIAILEAYTWLPLTLLLVRRAVSERYPRRWLLSAAVPLAFSLLAGHPQSFLHISYMAAAYYIYLTRRARWFWADILRGGAVVALVGVGLGAAAWLPALRFATRTVRSAPTYEFVATGLPMLNYIHLIVPTALGNMAPVYGGLAAVVFAYVAWTERHRQSEVVFWGITLLLSGWLALGDRGILFRLAYLTVPGFSLFRQQERLLGIFSLSLALLAGQGIGLWLRGAFPSDRPMRRFAVVLGGGLALSLVILAATTPAYGADWATPWLRQVVIAVLLLGLLRWASRQSSPFILGAMLLLLTADLMLVSRSAIERAPGRLGRSWLRPAWAAALPATGVYRIDSSNSYFANVGELLGVEDIRGISPLKPQALADLEPLPLERRWQLLNVVYALDPTVREDVPVTPITSGESGASTLYRFEEALPRAWMVYDVIEVRDPAAAMDVLQKADFAPEKTAVLQARLPRALDAISSPATAPDVEVSRESPARLTIDVNTAAPGLLVVSEWDYPGWRATRNGIPAELLTTNYALQGIMLPAGKHQVVLQYAPWDVPVGMGISLLTVVAGTLAALRGHRWQPDLSMARHRATGGAVPAAWPRALRNRGRWLLVGLVLLGFGLRAYNLGGQELRGDEAFSYLFSLPPPARIAENLLAEGDPHSPLSYLILHGWMALTGDSEFALRFPSLLAGVLALPLLYQVGRSLDRRRGSGVIGILALGGAVLSPGHIWLSQDVRSQYTLGILFSLLALWLLVRRSARDVAWRHWLPYAAAAALAVYSHYFSALPLLVHGFYVSARPGRRAALRRWIASGFVALLVFLPWLAAVVPQVLASGQLSDPGTPRLAVYLTSVGTELTVGLSLPVARGRWLFLGALALVAPGVAWLRRAQRGWAMLLTAWLGVTALVIYLVRFSRATFNPFYIGLALPAWWLLLAAGVTRIPRWRQWLLRLGGAAVTVAVGVGMLTSLKKYFNDPAYSRTLGYRSMANHVAQQAAPGDLFLAHFPDPALDYYLRDVDMPRTMQPACLGADPDDTVASLAALADKYRRIWFVPYHRSTWDPADTVAQWLEFNTLREAATTHNRLTLYAYRPVDDVDAVVAPSGARLGQQARLYGTYATRNGQPVDLEEGVIATAGDRLAITLVWDAMASFSRSYTVFVHLLAADGTLLAQHDGIPVQGTRPTPTWTAGERLLDRHELTLPQGLPVDAGRLVVGVYDSETIGRRPFADGAEVLMLGEVTFAQ